MNLPADCQITIGTDTVVTHATVTGAAWDCHCGKVIGISRLADGRVLLRHGDGEAARIFTREELPPRFLVSMYGLFGVGPLPTVMGNWLIAVHQYEGKR